MITRHIESPKLTQCSCPLGGELCVNTLVPQLEYTHNIMKDFHRGRQHKSNTQIKAEVYHKTAKT